MLNVRTGGFWSFVQEYATFTYFLKRIIIIYCNKCCIKTWFCDYRISSNKRRASNKHRILVSNSPLISAAPQNMALIGMVILFLYSNGSWTKCIWTYYANNKAMKILLILRFFHNIWFICSENVCLILILKEKLTRFWHLILFISLIFE